MNEHLAKTIAVSVIWIAAAAACMVGKMDADWLIFIAAGMTSYYIWIWDRNATTEQTESAIERLRKWNELREKGILTQKEFDDKKAELLAE